MTIKILKQKLSLEVDFKSEILNLISNKEQEIKIICPYLTLDIFKEIIEKSNNWKLITDIKALFLSTEKSKHIILREFINDNNNKIKHIDNVHAKAIILNDKALFGSANFTNSGLHKNIELSAIIDDSEKVKELNTWFDELWDKSKYLDIEKVTSFVNSISNNIIEINETYESINFDKNPDKTNDPINLIENNLNDYFADLVKDYEIKAPLIPSRKTIDDLYGRTHNKFTIWGDKYSVIISNLGTKIIDFDTLNKNDYTQLKNEKMLINNNGKIIEKKVSTIHTSSPIILGALLGFYKLIAKKQGDLHYFYILNSEINNLTNLKKLGFCFSKPKYFTFDTKMIDLKKDDKNSLLILVERYYQLYVNNSILNNPSWDKPYSIFKYWEDNMK